MELSDAQGKYNHDYRCVTVFIKVYPPIIFFIEIWKFPLYRYIWSWPEKCSSFQFVLHCCDPDLNDSFTKLNSCHGILVNAIVHTVMQGYSMNNYTIYNKTPVMAGPRPPCPPYPHAKASTRTRGRARQCPDVTALCVPIYHYSLILLHYKEKYNLLIV